MALPWTDVLDNLKEENGGTMGDEDLVGCQPK